MTGCPLFSWVDIFLDWLKEKRAKDGVTVEIVRLSGES